jgi:hypothetical protein
LTCDFWAENAKKSCNGNKAGNLWVEICRGLFAGQLLSGSLTAMATKLGDLWVEMCGGLLRNSSLGILHCAQDDSKGKGKGKGKGKARQGKGKAKADSPFDFVQGSLFGDDNQNGNCNGTAVCG